MEMVNAFKERYASLASPTELRLENADALEPKRDLPLGLAIHVWLKKPVLFGAALVAIAVTLFAFSLKKGEIPTFVALMIDRQIAKGVVDRVQRHEISKSKGMKETRWIVSYHFALPNGQQPQGESYTASTTLTKGATVEVEYHPKRPQANRILGMSAQSDDNNLLILGVIVMAVGAIIVASELRDSFRISRLLKSSLLGEAIVTHCKEVHSRGSFEINGFRWRFKPKGKEIPLTAYQQQVSNEHRIQFDSQGKFVGTRGLRYLHVAFAIFIGAIVFGFMSFVVAFLLFGAPKGWAILGGSLLGAAAMATVEVRWLMLLRSNVRTKVEDQPLRFKKAQCILRFTPLRCLELIRFVEDIDLKGDSTDALPRPILYSRNRPSEAMLLDEIGIHSSKNADGAQTLRAGNAFPLVTVFFVILATAILGPVIACLI